MEIELSTNGNSREQKEQCGRTLTQNPAESNRKSEHKEGK